MATSYKNLLLVEGKIEQYLLPYLIEKHTKWGEKKESRVVEIMQLGGVDEVLKPGVIEGESKTPGLGRVDNFWGLFVRRVIPLTALDPPSYYYASP
jgi:hypothetical protein